MSRWGNFSRSATVGADEGPRPPRRLRPKKLRPPPPKRCERKMEDVPHQSIDQAIGKLFGGTQTLSLNRPTRQNRKLTGQSVSNSSCRLFRFHFSGFPDRVRDTSLSFVPRHAAVVGRRTSTGGHILDAAESISRWGNFPRGATVSAGETRTASNLPDLNQATSSQRPGHFAPCLVRPRTIATAPGRVECTGSHPPFWPRQEHQSWK